MRVIWKYTLSPDQETVIEGGDPRVLHVGVDPLWREKPDLEANCPTVWVELDPVGGDTMSLVFVGTGMARPLGQTTRHVGSCVTPGGLVWHVYWNDAQVREFYG